MEKNAPPLGTISTASEPTTGTKVLTWAVVIIGTILVLRSSFKEA